MPEFFRRLFSSAEFMPHGHCYMWRPEIVWLHVLSDGLVALSYTTIPFTLFYFSRKRKDLPFNWMFVAFAVFIITCGATHAMEVVTLWMPVYRLSGIIKAITAVASVTTAILLVRLVPSALAIPRPADLRKAHDDLKSSERRLRGFLDSAPDAMVIADAGGAILFVNEQAQKLFGYSFDELVGRAVELLVPEGARSAHASYRPSFVRERKVRSMGSGLELFGRRKDGSLIPIEVSLSPSEGHDGLTVSAAIRDISERRRLEADAKLAAERLKNAVESIQDGFALYDEHDCLVSCNGVYRHLIGASLVGAVVGKPYKEIVEAWTRDNVVFESDEERARFCAEGLSDAETSRTIDLRTRDGRSLRIMDRRTSDGGRVETVWDLTDDQKHAEELRDARAAAETASAAKTEFLSSVSHELRTPLNAILGFGQILQRDKREPLSDRHRLRVDQMVRGGEHLLRLIEDVLHLSKIEAGRISLSPESVSVVEVLDEVRSTLEPMAALHGIALTVDLPTRPPPRVTADPTRFSQILMNFASNAIKYNRAGGSVTFVVDLSDEQFVRVSTRDTGMGIPLDKQSKIFEPFQRAGQETGSIEGTGIGLTITKRLAELMGGSVGFRSTPNEGSEFWVDMQVRPSGPPSVQPVLQVERVPPRRADGKASLVLYVEDNPANVKFMRDLMSSVENVELVTVPSAELGVDMARARRPEIIVLDVHLPGMSGLEALRALRAGPDTEAIPVIGLSAAASEHDRRKGEEAGFSRYLTKPLNVDEFLLAVQSLLASAPAERRSDSRVA